MLNPNSHLIGDMARMHREELVRQADEYKLRRLTAFGRHVRWAKLRTAVGDWLIASGQQLKPEPRPMIGRQAHQS